jgi:hypothetical protein
VFVVFGCSGKGEGIREGYIREFKEIKEFRDFWKGVGIITP